MTTFISSIAWQYTAVTLILIGCMAWMVWTLHKRMNGKKQGKRTYCSGCSLTETCSKKSLLQRTDIDKKTDRNHCNKTTFK